MPSLDRRSFLKGAAAAGLGAATLGNRIARGDVAFNPLKELLVKDTATPITHVVVVMMENRSVDHYLGWHTSPDGFDARTDVPFANALTTTDWGATPTRTDGGGTDFSGCGYQDPGHGWGHGRAQLGSATFAGYDPGAAATWAEGWRAAGSGNDEYALSYYDPADLPVTRALVEEFTTFDRYFCSVLGSTYPNREYMHSAQSGGIHNNDFPPQRTGSGPARRNEWATGFDWPTIWDALERAGVSWGYYFSNLPVIGLWGKRFAPNTRYITDYFVDAAAGTLPQVSFVDPFFVAPEGLANDDHPHADVRLGQEFLAGVANAFGTSPCWPTGALFITYDEWGGFADRVPPPVVADPRATFDPLAPSTPTSGLGGFGQLGFRVPTVLMSPYARGRRVDHGVYDHTSILGFIEQNFVPDPAHRLTSLDPAGARPVAAPGQTYASTGRVENIGAAFDFTNPPDPTPFSFPYTAPPEAHVPCEARGHEAPAAELWRLAENGWLEAQGYRIETRIDGSFGR